MTLPWGKMSPVDIHQSSLFSSLKCRKGYWLKWMGVTQDLLSRSALIINLFPECNTPVFFLINIRQQVKTPPFYRAFGKVDSVNAPYVFY